ncbi:hypothetical protein CBR_g68202, partial [Chara braunii]
GYRVHTIVNEHAIHDEASAQRGGRNTPEAFPKHRLINSWSGSPSLRKLLNPPDSEPPSSSSSSSSSLQSPSLSTSSSAPTSSSSPLSPLPSTSFSASQTLSNGTPNESSTPPSPASSSSSTSFSSSSSFSVPPSSSAAEAGGSSDIASESPSSSTFPEAPVISNVAGASQAARRQGSKRENQPPPGVVFPAAIIAAIAMLGLVLYALRRKAGQDTDFQDGNRPTRRTSILAWAEVDMAERVRFSRLKRATKDFDESHRVKGDEDGVGDIYRGNLIVTGLQGEVAIKRLRGSFDLKGEKSEKADQFVSELAAIARARHRAISKPIAYSINGNEALVVYAFNTKGSLRDLLGPGIRKLGDRKRDRDDPVRKITRLTSFSFPANVLPWPARVEIVKQVALALRYLHEELYPPLFHRNVKSTNVMVELRLEAEGVRAYLTDFGFESVENWTSTGERTRQRFGLREVVGVVMGRENPLVALTGYEPRTAEVKACSRPVGDGGVVVVSSSSSPAARADVYAFGVVLLEIVTGRTAVFPTEEEDLITLTDWCRRWLFAAAGQSLVREMVDPRIVLTLNERQWQVVNEIAWLGLECTRDDPAERGYRVHTIVNEHAIHDEASAQRGGRNTPEAFPKHRLINSWSGSPSLRKLLNPPDSEPPSSSSSSSSSLQSPSLSTSSSAPTSSSSPLSPLPSTSFSASQTLSNGTPNESSTPPSPASSSSSTSFSSSSSFSVPPSSSAAEAGGSSDIASESPSSSTFPEAPVISNVAGASQAARRQGSKRENQPPPGVVFPAAIIAAIAMLGLVLYALRRKAGQDTDFQDGNRPTRRTSILAWAEVDMAERVRFSRLKRATKDFDESHRVKGDEDGVGDIYRGNLIVTGLQGEVAIKRLRGSFDLKGEKSEKADQFVSELAAIARARHRAISKPIAYSINGNEALVVYAFNTKGSLRDLLGPGIRKLGDRKRDRDDPVRKITRLTSFSFPANVLPWPARVEIVKQVALALRYLHEELYPPLFHRNVKSTNVMVELRLEAEGVRAYLTDFGFESVENWTSTGERTRQRFGLREVVGVVMGRENPLVALTGYEPRTAEVKACSRPVGDGGVVVVSSSSSPAARADVYAFGVVLLEIVTGRTAVFPTEEEDLITLTDWCRRWLFAAAGQSLVREMVDPRIVLTLNERQWQVVNEIAWLGLECTRDDPAERPTTQNVLHQLISIAR